MQPLRFKIFNYLRDHPFLLLLRRILGSWPGYQMVPRHSKLHTVKLKLRVSLSLASAIIRQDNKSRKSLRKSKDLKGSRSGPILILANGPSTNQISLQQILRFKNAGGSLIAMNGFVYSELSNLVAPEFYLLSDPDAWTLRKEEDYEFLNRLNSLLSNSWSETFVVQPVHQPNVSTLHLSYIYLTNLTSSGLFKGRNPFGIWGLAPSTALLAFAVADFLGYEPIYFAGLDGDSYRYFKSDDLNLVSWENPQHHFYQDISQKFDNTNSSFHGIDVYESIIPTIADALYAEAIMRRDFEYISKGRFINVSGSLYNDTSPRASLLK